MNVSISRNGTELGEWSEDQVRSLYKEGQFLPTDHYWKEGMAQWEELSKMIKPPPPKTDNSQAITVSDDVQTQENRKPLLEVGIGRLLYLGIMLLVTLALSGASSLAKSDRYDSQDVGGLEILVGLVGMGVALFTIFLRLKNIGNSTTKSVVFTILAAIPLLSIPVGLFCLFLPTGYANKAKTLHLPD